MLIGITGTPGTGKSLLKFLFAQKVSPYAHPCKSAHFLRLTDFVRPEFRFFASPEQKAELCRRETPMRSGTLSPA